MNIDTLTRAIQKAVNVLPDGKIGPQTLKAIYKAVTGNEWSEPGETETRPGLIGAVDERSERNIATLLPEVRDYARALVQRAAARGITIKVISGTRTYAEQDALYAQGRSKPGKVVTNARGGYSNHNFGIAFDIGIFDGAKYIPESPAYKAVGAIGADLGLDWGGNWKTIKDEPHYQLRPRWASGISEKEMLAELRSRRASGKNAFA